jgi:integrase/recombinase XerD
VVRSWAAAGIAASTRRSYLQAFKGFHEFLTARKAGQIEAVFGVRLESPLDEFNAARHVACEPALATAPPPPERLAEFFEFLRGRVATARKFGSAGRDYALYRTPYHAGLRAEEAASLELPDLHFGRDPFGKIHVRFGKGAKTSGPRPRWVPMLDLILRWFTDDVRTRFPASAALFCDEGGGRLHRGAIRNRLRHLLDLEGRPAADRFTPHTLHHACATVARYAAAMTTAQQRARRAGTRPRADRTLAGDLPSCGISPGSWPPGRPRPTGPPSRPPTWRRSSPCGRPAGPGS